MPKYEKGIVASGHPLVSEAAATILREGGNAFDAVVAAGFTSTVVEQTLTSLAGGGFVLAHSEENGRDIFFDFFVDTPGRGLAQSKLPSHFFPVTIQFLGAPQVFNIGLGAVAVPGVAKGLLHVHKRLGRMGLDEVVAPAVEHALGHEVNGFQASFLQLLTPIVTQTATGRNLYGNENDFIRSGDWLVNEDLASTIRQLAEDGGESFYGGDTAGAIVDDMREKGGLLTREDLAGYQVYERTPLSVPYNNHVFLTAPPPSVGGSLIALSLSLYGACNDDVGSWGGSGQLRQTLAVMQEVERLRRNNVTTPEALTEFLGKDIAQSVQRLRVFSRGTTHVSVSDSDGNCASMTCSNGEGCGWYAPGTGVMLNNMMGEDDLHPDGFHLAPAGQRVGSMMSPSMLMRDGHIELVIGSGGSKRIRSAITEVLRQVIDFGRGIRQAVEAPRMFWDGDCLQAEPGFSQEALAALGADVNIWDVLDVYFGGVHAVIPGIEGAGDPRRGGAVATTE